MAEAPADADAYYLEPVTLDEEDDDAEGEIESGVIPARESESERRGVF